MNVRMKPITSEMSRYLLRTVGDLINEADHSRALLRRAHAVMLRCHWDEPTGLEGDEDSALQVERDGREFLGK